MAAILPDGKLRRVEETVLIPKMMREEAMKRCGKFVEGGSLRLNAWMDTPLPQLLQSVAGEGQ
eukprot:m.44771 g.44771  ORF g.44771 m.44771 type:complete len:63 (+) comp33548_c1_seq1:341-529(+)